MAQPSVQLAKCRSWPGWPRLPSHQFSKLRVAAGLDGLGGPAISSVS